MHRTLSADQLSASMSDLCGIVCKLFICAIMFLPGFSYSQSVNHPCATAQHRQFDFWVGKWEVYNPKGDKVGENTIHKILNDCVIYENWQSARSEYEGKSFNTYDMITKSWNQVWVDTSGATIHFNGARTENIMSMTGSHKTANGIVYYKMSYTLNQDGTIRQLWEQSKDKQSWEPIFDGLYRKASRD